MQREEKKEDKPAPKEEKKPEAKEEKPQPPPKEEKPAPKQESKPAPKVDSKEPSKVCFDHAVAPNCQHQSIVNVLKNTITNTSSSGLDLCHHADCSSILMSWLLWIDTTAANWLTVLYYVADKVPQSLHVYFSWPLLISSTALKQLPSWSCCQSCCRLPLSSYEVRRVQRHPRQTSQGVRLGGRREGSRSPGCGHVWLSASRVLRTHMPC